MVGSVQMYDPFLLPRSPLGLWRVDLYKNGARGRGEIANCRVRRGLVPPAKQISSAPGDSDFLARP